MATPIIPFLTVLALSLPVCVPSKAVAGAHSLELALETCNNTEAFAKFVIEKRNGARPFSYYNRIELGSPAAWEIIMDAYEARVVTGFEEKQNLALEFSQKWFEQCVALSCSGFWENLEADLQRVWSD